MIAAKKAARKTARTIPSRVSTQMKDQSQQAAGITGTTAASVFVVKTGIPEKLTEKRYDRYNRQTLTGSLRAAFPLKRAAPKL
jgi:hypothetical protein